ncbi:hypothetical protein BDZ89DRAFT_1038336 [Hymenopellis radicata]|nr:hypothetical protein BDZ89DRAFT_1038336 [Hymenopellis radicata]
MPSSMCRSEGNQDDDRVPTGGDLNSISGGAAGSSLEISLFPTWRRRGVDKASERIISTSASILRDPGSEVVDVGTRCGSSARVLTVPSVIPAQFLEIRGQNVENAIETEPLRMRRFHG